MFAIKKKITYISLILALSLIIQGCWLYSFTGADYGNAKTVTIHYFDNQANIVNPDLAPMLTEKLQDKFINESPLTIVEDGGDLEFSGQIIGYTVAPAQIQAGETAATNRLTIKVRVKFTNNLEPEKSYEKTFSWYADFESDKNLADVENELIDQITDKLVDDIFNAAVVNW